MGSAFDLKTATATSWDNRLVEKLLEMRGVETAGGNTCTFNMKQKDTEGKSTIKKTTRFVINAPRISDKLRKECRGALPS